MINVVLHESNVLKLCVWTCVRLPKAFVVVCISKDKDKDKMTVYVLGESHTEIYNQFHRILLNACTMHRLARDGMMPTIEGALWGKAYPQTGDVLVVVLGEVDCRCHVHRQIVEKNRTEEEVLEDLASRYIKALVEYKNGTGVKIGVRGVVPPLKDGRHHDENYPIRGAFIDRLRWRNTLNAKLEQKCKEHDLLYVPSPPWAENEDGSMKFEFSDEIIHIHARYAPEASQNLRDIISTLSG